MTARRTVARLLVECLRAEGVEYVFGVPGEETMDILDALADEPAIQNVTVRHEQGAAFAADEGDLLILVGTLTLPLLAALASVPIEALNNGPLSDDLDRRMRIATVGVDSGRVPGNLALFIGGPRVTNGVVS